MYLRLKVLISINGWRRTNHSFSSLDLNVVRVAYQKVSHLIET